MKTLIYLAIIFILFSCGNYSEPKVFELEYPERRETEEVKTESTSAEDTMDYECTRSIPSPVLDSSHFRDWSFKLNKILDGNVLEGTESAQLKSGTHLKITNSGCEYYTLIFEFTTFDHKEKITNLSYWAKKTVELLHEIKAHCDASIDWKILEKELLSYYEENSNSELNHELIINDSEIGTSAYLEKLEQLDKQSVKISLCYTVGPL
jgi:hypothetical protein